MPMTRPRPDVLPTYLEILTQLPAYVTACDAERRVLWHNRWAFGFGPDHLGADAADCVHEEDRPAWVRAFRLAADEGRTVHGACRTAAPDGGPELRWSYRMAPLLCDGRRCGVLVCSWDVDGHPPPGPPPDPPSAPASPRPAPPGGAFLFSPLAARIVAFLRERPHAKGLVLGRHLGLVGSGGTQASSKVRALLADLEERGVLARGPLGYHLTAPFRSTFPS